MGRRRFRIIRDGLEKRKGSVKGNIRIGNRGKGKQGRKEKGTGDGGPGKWSIGFKRLARSPNISVLGRADKYDDNIIIIMVCGVFVCICAYVCLCVCVCARVCVCKQFI